MNKLLTALAFLIATPTNATEMWQFNVLYDGKSVGSHSFEVTRDTDTIEVQSKASFDIKFLFITAYKYRHQAQETWRDGCLQSLNSSTDANGDIFEVKADQNASTFDIVVKENETLMNYSVADCAGAFAYWDPALLQRSTLINVQTGIPEAVTVTDLGVQSVTIPGLPAVARHLNISGKDILIDVYYAEDNDRWVGLRSDTEGGGELVYTLLQEEPKQPRRSTEIDR